MCSVLFRYIFTLDIYIYCSGYKVVLYLSVEPEVNGSLGGPVAGVQYDRGPETDSMDVRAELICVRIRTSG
jgi:hypothetical protein